MDEVIWESWLCPKCRFLYEQDEYEFVDRPPRCLECDTVCEKSRWWNRLPRKLRIVSSVAEVA